MNHQKLEIVFNDEISRADAEHFIEIIYKQADLWNLTIVAVLDEVDPEKEAENVQA